MKTTPEKRSDFGEARRHLLSWMAVGIVIGGLIGVLIDDVDTMLLLGWLSGFAIGSRGGRSLGLMEYPPGVMRRLAISVVLFVGVLSGAFYLLDQEYDQTFKVVIALFPALPALFFVISIGKAMSSLDEFQRRIQLEAIGIGFAFSGIAALSYAMLGLAGVEQGSWFFVPVVMTFGWFIGKIWTLWKYR
jgi:hypothetical protein